MPAEIPSADHLLKSTHQRESVCKILYRDGLPTDWAPATSPSTTSSETPTERLMNEHFWHPISALLYSTLHPSAKADGKHFTALSTNLAHLRREQEQLAATPAPSCAAVDAPPMIHENMLMASYSALEIARTLPRLATEIRDKVLQSKTPHALKPLVPKDWAKQIDADAKGAFDAVGKLASRYIDTLQTRGAAVFKAQVRWGRSGAALQSLVSDEDVEHYAREYVDSAVEAWRGVLQVKLK